ncbi:hypothetical protein LTR94_032350, partial [Friedmanniomyces endolithicus]
LSAGRPTGRQKKMDCARRRGQRRPSCRGRDRGLADGAAVRCDDGDGRTAHHDPCRWIAGPAQYRQRHIHRLPAGSPDRACAERRSRLFGGARSPAPILGRSERRIGHGAGHSVHRRSSCRQDAGYRYPAQRSRGSAGRRGLHRDLEGRP